MPFVLRRTKKEVIYDCLDKIEKNRLVEMAVAQNTSEK
jgi:SNF2 family DNA or RNA helicase